MEGDVPRSWHIQSAHVTLQSSSGSISVPIKTIPGRPTSLSLLWIILPVQQGNRFNALPEKNANQPRQKLPYARKSGFQLTGMKFHYATCIFRRHGSFPRLNGDQLDGNNNVQREHVTSGMIVRNELQLCTFCHVIRRNRCSSWSNWTSIVMFV